MIDMTGRQILPAAARFARSLAETVSAMQAACKGCDVSYESETLKKVSDLTKEIYEQEKRLDACLEKLPADIGKQGHYFHELVLPAMESLRSAVDSLEVVCPKDLWPLPSYGDLLFSVR